MATTLVQDKKQTKLINRVATLERMLFELRSNQTKKLNWAGLQVDGTGSTGVISGTNGPLLGVDGIDSLNNFSHSQVTNFVTQTTTSTTPVAVPGSTMTPLVLTDSTYVLLYLFMGGYTVTWPDTLTITILDGSTTLQTLEVFGIWFTGVSQDPVSLVVSTSYQTATQFASITQLFQLAAGSHTFSLQMNVGLGGNTGYLDDFVLGYIVLGT